MIYPLRKKSAETNLIKIILLTLKKSCLWYKQKETFDFIINHLGLLQRIEFKHLV